MDVSRAYPFLPNCFDISVYTKQKFKKNYKSFWGFPRFCISIGYYEFLHEE